MSEPDFPALRLPEVIEGQSFTDCPKGARVADTVYLDCRFDGVQWSGCRLQNVRFVNCDFKSNGFLDCEFNEVSCEGSHMQSIEWTNCTLRKLSICNTSIHNAHWNGGLIREAIYADVKGSAWTFNDVCSAHASAMTCELTDVRVLAGKWTDTSWVNCQLTDVGIDSTELENVIVGQSHCNRFAVAECTGINVRWIGCEIGSMKIVECALKQAAWSHSSLSGCVFETCTLPLASFDSANISQLTLTNVEMERAIFDEACVSSSVLRQLRAPLASFRNAKFRHVQLESALLSGLDARGAELEGVDLTGADCRSARLTGQPQFVWSAANTSDAIFDEAAYDDRLWWQQVQPGARGVSV